MRSVDRMGEHPSDPVLAARTPEAAGRPRSPAASSSASSTEATTNQQVRARAVSAVRSPFASDEETHAEYRLRTRHGRHRHAEVIPDMFGAMREIVKNGRGA
jgi:predicted nuclease with RNAse H fold